VADVLPRAKSTARGTDNHDGAEHDQNKTDVFLRRSGFFQNNRRQQRHDERHHAREQRAAVRRWCKQQAGIHQKHHRCDAAD